MEQGLLSTTLAASARADRLAPIHGCGRSCFLWKKRGGGKNRCDPVLQSAGQHAEPSPAQCWGNSALCSAVEKKVEAGRHFQKNHLPGGSRTFSGGGCCYCFGSRVGTAPGYLCASAVWQLASPFFLFFPLRKHPQKGHERLQQFLSADLSAENKAKFSGMILLL